MIILSIHDGHNASAALYKDGVLLSCISEERITRKKFFWGWPEHSIAFVIKDSGISYTDVTTITISHLSGAQYFFRKWSLPSSYKIWKLKAFVGHFYNIYESYKKEFRVRKFRNNLCPRADIFFCDHHFAHAASAYYCSGESDALIVTCDYLGDALSHTAYSVSNGHWKLIVKGDSPESLGAFYGAITEGLGFKPNQHEGKIVGLAAYAPANVLVDRMRSICVHDTKNSLHFRRRPYKEMVASIRQLLAEGYSKEEISSAAQSLLENLMILHIKSLLKMYPHKTLCVAGGVFANVKLNQRLVEQTSINRIYVQPAMGDEGLVLGSALTFMYKKKQGIAPTLEDMYLGTHFTNDEIIDILKNEGRTFSILTTPAEEIAEKISEGVIVGIFDGRMEFGPRALGARSIVADPRNSNVNAILNERLNRSEFMPFAPSVLCEMADEIFINVEPARHAAEFMTITFNVQETWREKIPAIVHIDGTARPQLVKKETNTHYYELISAFYRKTGIPLVMNTSFNMHEEPIVSSPSDALRSLDSGAVDGILFNGSLYVTK